MDAHMSGSQRIPLKALNEDLAQVHHSGQKRQPVGRGAAASGIGDGLRSTADT